VRGFEDDARFNVEPCYLAKEGLSRFLEFAALGPEAVKEVRRSARSSTARAVET
jgi:hypothetical protein